MTGDHTKPSGAVGHMAISSAKVLLFLALLAQVCCMAEGVSACCVRRPRACGLYGVRCNSTDSKPVRVSSGAAVGILTLGKRRTAGNRYQDRLQHLLHGTRNQAAGILTMGKRHEEGGAHPQPGVSTVHSLIKLDLEKPVQYLLQQQHTDTRDPYRP
ncbi:orexin [Astyanax mexicanus]|uniref:orexin n=1 Tax=Astyanax mexicanus TaxID=7994 RepID=UPI0020CAB29B|nr:orexin [Astyanax mexicanus]